MKSLKSEHGIQCMPCSTNLSTETYDFLKQILFLKLLCPITKGEGGHIGFSADPGRRRRLGSLYPPYFLNQWVELYHTCMDTSLGQAKGLIKF